MNSSLSNSFEIIGVENLDTINGGGDAFGFISGASFAAAGAIAMAGGYGALKGGSIGARLGGYGAIAGGAIGFAAGVSGAIKSL